MRHKYPCIGEIRKWNKVIGKCKICGQDAEYTVDVQYTIFRGDDEVYKACRECVTSKKIDEAFLKG